MTGPRQSAEQKAALRERMRRLREERRKSGVVQFIIYIPDHPDARKAAQQFAERLCARWAKPKSTGGQFDLFGEDEGE